MMGLLDYGQGLLDPQEQQFLRQQGLLNLGASLLANSGPSTTKRGTGQILGQSFLQSQGGQMQALQGLLSNKLLKGKLEEGDAEKRRQKGLLDLVGNKGQIMPNDELGIEQGGTGLLGGQLTPQQFSAGVAGLGGDYAKLGLRGLMPDPANTPSAVREWEYFQGLSPENQTKYLGMKRQMFGVNEIGGVPNLVARAPGIAPQPLSTLEKEVQGKAAIAGGTKAATVTAEGQATANLELPKAEATAEQTKKLINELRNHPGRKLATGTSSLVPRIPGTAQGDFITRLDQIKGQQFLAAYQALKGAGQITEIEGSKAENAIARMDRSQTEGEFLKALSDFEEAVDVGFSKLKERAGKPTTANTSAKPANTKRIRVDAQGNVLD